MEAHELATLFQRFRRRGDPRALGAVFDATAPELLRTALHLVGDAALAEDAVQETFLVALERRDEYDVRRPLVPWLAGILANQARAARRRRPRGAEPDEALAAPARDPGRRAAEREVDELVQAAIDALPEELRQALTLNLRHGLAPAEIAHALGLSPSTVRTRLARGRDRLRDRLPAEVASVALLAAPALRGLADVRAVVLERAAALVPAGLAVTLATAALSMKLLVPAVALVAAAALWWTSQSAPDDLDRSLAAAPATPAPGAAAPVAPATVATPPAVADGPERTAVEAAPPPTVAAEGEAPAPVVEETPEPDHHDVEFLVVDPYDVPVPEAQIRFQFVGSDSASWAWPFEPPVLETDAAGRARLRLPRRSWDRTIEKYSFEVLHERFGAREHVEEATGGTVRVVLEPGVFVIVTGWIGSRDRVVTDLRIQSDHEAKLSPDQWTPLRDGRLACSRLQAGPHVLFLEHVDAGGQRWFSRLVDLELAAGEQRELHVELLPARTIRGRLDPAVPRPVTNGRVTTALHNGRVDWDAPVLFDMRDADIAADGTFEIEEAPPQFLDVVAVCDGWSSTPPPVEPGREWMDRIQRFGPDELEDEVVVAMQPTASLELTFLDPDGRPLSDAWVILNPNVHWNAGYATILFGEGVSARSDAAGRAVIQNLLPGDEWASMGHADFVLGPDQTIRMHEGQPYLELVSGETLRAELHMVPRPER